VDFFITGAAIDLLVLRVAISCHSCPSEVNALGCIQYLPNYVPREPNPIDPAMTCSGQLNESHYLTLYGELDNHVLVPRSRFLSTFNSVWMQE
jgi:hypothetical protein